MADTRQTLASQKAWGIYAEVSGLEHPFTQTYNLKGEGLQVAKTLRALMGAASKTGVSIVAREDYIVVGTRRYLQTPVRREAILEDMIRRLAMHVDDEKLYEEAMKLVGVI